VYRIAIMALALAVACAPAEPIGTVGAPALTPYATITPSLTADPAGNFIVAAETPLPTPTPSQYTIKSGDTLSQIAERFRITLDALLLANPGVDPTALRIGDSLQIPASPADRAGEATPTPVPLAVRQVGCHATADGGVWCFVLVFNDTPDLVEDVTAQVTLVEANGSVFTSALAVLPLDIIPPGVALPLSVFFSPPIPLDTQPRVQMLTGIRLLPGDPRYIAASARNTIADVSPQGRSAEASGEIVLTDPSRTASSLWVAAVAYDAAGQVVGWRRWESTTPLGPGSPQPFSMTISSVAGPIRRVEFAVEARP
jgi:LysM repeat protein